jgi:hypothetical protein
VFGLQETNHTVTATQQPLAGILPAVILAAQLALHRQSPKDGANSVQSCRRQFFTAW